MLYYKAVRPNGRDFYSDTIDYAAALGSGDVIRHSSTRKTRDLPSTYISVSVEPADCTGFSWPCRLFRVEPVGRVMSKLSASPNKRAVSALRVVEELPAHQALGPNGEAVAAFLERVRGLNGEQAKGLQAALDAARYAAWDAALDAARDAALDAVLDAVLEGAAWCAARDAAVAILTRDLITVEHYDILVEPFRDAGVGEWVA